VIPIRDTIRPRHTPLVNYALILTNVILLIHVQRLGASAGEAYLLEHGAVPVQLLSASGPREAFTLISSLFLHGGWLHLLSNMWALWIFGDNVEDRLGPVGYLFFYLACGAIANLVHVHLNPASDLPVVGASGAIAGVMGAYLLTFPRARVITLVPIGFLWLIRVPAVLYLGGWLLLQLFSGIQTLTGEAAQSGLGGVAWWAHVGGFLAGMLLIRVMPRRRSGSALRGIERG